MDIIKVYILILASILIGMFIAGILITFSLKNARLETCRRKEMKKFTLIKLKVEDEAAYLINDRSFWDCIELIFYLMFGRFFYKSPLIWKEEKRIKIYFTIATIFLILILGFAIIY